MRPATRPLIASRDGRLLLVGAAGVSHLTRADLPSLLHPGDLLVANDAATLPASLSGIHDRTAAPVEVRLAAMRSLDPWSVRRVIAVVFGAGDYRTPTEDRPLPPPLAPGDELRFVPPHAATVDPVEGADLAAPPTAIGLFSRESTLVAHVVNVCGHPRLVELEFSGTLDSIWRWLATAGRPVQYAYVPDPLEIWDTWTRMAARPVAFEPPSAGFILDWSMLKDIRKRGVRFATITHAAGLSSTGDADLDRRLPLDEPYEIPASTADLIARTRAAGRRVIAIGTTVARALESAVDGDGHVRAGAGLATLRLGPHSRLAVVDGLVSGMHESGTSHYHLLEAFADDAALQRMTAAAEARGYRGHEFGDFVLVERRRTEITGAEETETEETETEETETEATEETGSQTGERGNGDERDGLETWDGLETRDGSEGRTDCKGLGLGAGGRAADGRLRRPGHRRGTNTSRFPRSPLRFVFCSSRVPGSAREAGHGGSAICWSPDNHRPRGTL